MAVPPFQVINATHTFLRVLHDFREKKGEGGGGDVCCAGLIQIPVIDVGPGRPWADEYRGCRGERITC